MNQPARYALGVLLMVGLSGCPVTDDYYLLSADESNGRGGDKGGDGNQAGSSTKAGSGGSSHGGQGPLAGSAGDMAVAAGGAGNAGGAPDTGDGGQPPLTGEGGASSDPCMPTTERCNGHDDDCDDLVDELVCPSSCSGFVLPADPSHGYMFCTGAREADWSDAKQACEDEDMRLAWLNSSAENAAVVAMLANLGSDAEILFGATDQGSEGDWLWVGGEQFWEGDEKGNSVAGRYNNWASGTPNNSSNEDCALVSTVTGTWGDRTCSSTYPYVCEQRD
jgi:hypothetical protein